MFRKTPPAHWPCAIVLVGLVAALSASAQEPRAAPVRLPADLVKTGLYVIHGGRSNSLLRLSANGLVVVNSNTAADYDALMRQIHRISDQPVRVLIDTDYREEHTGNNGRFFQAGTGILAHENVKAQLAAYSPTGGKITLPTKTFDREFTVRGGGIEVQTLHFGNARTNGDAVVYFADLKVVAVGDLFAAAPDPDYSAGGSLLGWAPVLDQILKLDFDTVVPGAGPTVSRADLQAFKTRIETLTSHAAKLVKQGLPKDQLMARLNADGPGWRFNLTADQVDGFYAELSKAK